MALILQIIECITLIYVFLFENHQNCTEELKLTLFGGMWGGEIQEFSNSDEFSTLYSITFSLFSDAIRTKCLFFLKKNDSPTGVQLSRQRLPQKYDW